jgi:hypothetical protein
MGMKWLAALIFHGCTPSILNQPLGLPHFLTARTIIGPPPLDECIRLVWQMVLQSVLSLRALSMPDPGNVAMENLPINGGLTGKIIYKWWIFQQAMFDYRRVPLWPSLGCPVSVGTGVFCSKDMALVSWKQLIDPRGWCCFDVGIPKQIVVVISHLLLCILIIYI